tara:strand:- start:362 stop:724 length:363 start_codon:yes stop_codon:yes gene_type:complete
MNIEHKVPERIFKVGADKQIKISHVADIQLEDNEQITLIGDSGTEFDVVKKNWGYYATPSINKRLKSFGFKTALIQNKNGHIYIFLVEPGKLDDFNKYCSDEDQTVLAWLDQIACNDSDN